MPKPNVQLKIKKAKAKTAEPTVSPFGLVAGDVQMPKISASKKQLIFTGLTREVRMVIKYF